MKGDARLLVTILDTELHFIIEQNFESSAKKFARYSLPGIVSELAKSGDDSPERTTRKRKPKKLFK